MATRFICIKSSGAGGGNHSGTKYNKGDATAACDIVIESGRGGQDGYGMKYNKAHAGAARTIVIESPPSVDYVKSNKIKGENIDELAGAFINKYRQKLRHQLEET